MPSRLPPTGVLLLALLWLSPALASTTADLDVDMNYRLDTLVEQPTSGRPGHSTADHSKFTQLQGPFADGPAVTKACLECHTEAGHQFQQNIHWTWSTVNEKTGQQLGKRHLVNNFCTNARGNEGMCAQCHAGYGWKDDNFDFTDQSKIDCVVCHDRTGTYYKTPTSGGNKACSVMFEGKQPIQWEKVAQSVGLPGRENCGGCHFYGGGGDGVKHGDLDSSLIHPDHALDVHMDEKGLGFACTECHVTTEHVWAGSRYQMDARDLLEGHKPGQARDAASCESCHSTAPHANNSIEGIKLNDHVKRVACQTCHIPEYARGGVATKVDWDWRTAGRLRDGEGYKEKGYTQGNGEHRATYKSIKGSFVYGENLQPEYGWFNGEMLYTTIDTVFDPTQAPIAINQYQGEASDPEARIWPFKPMHTVQPFDKGNNTLVYMHLWGDDADAFWGNYNFERAIARGMSDAGLPYSGEHGFVETVSYWPITHMVAPSEQALECQECHAKDGRLGALPGVYLPGRDSPKWLDLFGLALIAATLLGVLGHALIRLIARNRRAHS